MGTTYKLKPSPSPYTSVLCPPSSPSSWDFFGIIPNSLGPLYVTVIHLATVSFLLPSKITGHRDVETMNKWLWKSMETSEWIRGHQWITWASNAFAGMLSSLLTIFSCSMKAAALGVDNLSVDDIAGRTVNLTKKNHRSSSLAASIEGGTEQIEKFHWLMWVSTSMNASMFFSWFAIFSWLTRTAVLGTEDLCCDVSKAVGISAMEACRLSGQDKSVEEETGEKGGSTRRLLRSIWKIASTDFPQLTWADLVMDDAFMHNIATEALGNSMFPKTSAGS